MERAFGLGKQAWLHTSAMKAELAVLGGPEQKVDVRRRPPGGESLYRPTPATSLTGDEPGKAASLKRWNRPPKIQSGLSVAEAEANFHGCKTSNRPTSTRPI
jgi:hypothetical protein